MSHRITAVLAGASVLALFGGLSAASANHNDIHDSVGSYKIADNSIVSADVRDGGLGLRDFNKYTAGTINSKADKSYVDDNDAFLLNKIDGKADAEHNHDGRYYTKEEADQKFGKPAPVETQTVTLSTETGNGNVANIGGRFSERATVIDEFTLTEGTYQLSADGFFVSKEATSGLTRLQLAVRTVPGEGEQWGKDLGTCFTGAASELANREATCATNRVVSVDGDTPVKVFAFGYADDQGSADSGKFDAYSVINILKVG